METYNFPIRDYSLTPLLWSTYQQVWSPKGPNNPHILISSPICEQNATFQELEKVWAVFISNKKRVVPLWKQKVTKFSESSFSPNILEENRCPSGNKRFLNLSLQHSLVNILPFLQYFESPHTSSDSTTFDCVGWKISYFINLDSLCVNLNCGNAAAK